MQAPPHIDGRDDLAAQVDQAFDDFRRLGYSRHVLEAQNLLNAENIHTEEQVSHEEGGELSAALSLFRF
jgi:hypothetical protein